MSLVKMKGRHATLRDYHVSSYISSPTYSERCEKKKDKEGYVGINYPPETSSPFAQGSKMNRPKPMYFPGLPISYMSHENKSKSIKKDM